MYVSEEDGEIFYKAKCHQYELGVYEQDGIVNSVWYNDSCGRLTTLGKQRKIDLYLCRYAPLKNWERRMSNDWITHYYNDCDGLHMAYGKHKDVIRINKN